MEFFPSKSLHETLRNTSPSSFAQRRSIHGKENRAAEIDREIADFLRFPCPIHGARRLRHHQTPLRALERIFFPEPLSLSLSLQFTRFPSLFFYFVDSSSHPLQWMLLLQVERLGRPFGSSKVRDRELMKGAPTFIF